MSIKGHWKVNKKRKKHIWEIMLTVIISKFNLPYHDYSEENSTSWHTFKVSFNSVIPLGNFATSWSVHRNHSQNWKNLQPVVAYSTTLAGGTWLLLVFMIQCTDKCKGTTGCCFYQIWQRHDVLKGLSRAYEYSILNNAIKEQRAAVYRW